MPQRNTRRRRIRRLQAGDEVKWNDPNGGKCSRVIRISRIDFLPDDGVRIVDRRGAVLDCFVHELS